MLFKDELWALHPGMAADILRRMAEHASATKIPTGQPDIYTVNGQMAVIAINGPIDRESWFFAIGQNDIRAALDAAMADSAVKGILLAINSPGGVVAGTKELADHISKCAKIKPLAAYADGLCASAAYWLAAATGRIFAPATAQIGSIGVIAVHTSWQKALQSAGIETTFIYSGKYKAAGHPEKSLAESERQLFQSRIDAIHEIFKADVGRYMRPKGDDWAEGQTFLAAEAKKRGLITAIVRDQAEALNELAAIAGKKEHKMDLTQLKAEQPGLLAEYAAELNAKHTQEMEAVKAAAASELAQAKAGAEAARSEVLAVVKAVNGSEAAANVEKLLAAGVTAEQFAAVKGFSPTAATAPMQPAAITPENRAVSDIEKASATLLAAIQLAHGGPLPTAPLQQAKSPLVADAERRAMEAK